jgi:hypothetical protein
MMAHVNLSGLYDRERCVGTHADLSLCVPAALKPYFCHKIHNYLRGSLAAGTVVVTFLLEDKPHMHKTTPVEQLPLVTLKYFYPIHATRLHLEEM